MSSRVPMSALLAVGGVVAVVLLALAIGAGVTDPFDRPIIVAVRADALHDLLSPLSLVTQLGSTWAITVMGGVVLLVGQAIGSWREGAAAALTVLLASIGNSLLKVSIARDRPDVLEPVIVEHGFSFPSGHSALSMVAYGVLAVMIWRSSLPRSARLPIVVALGVLVGLIGLSRVWLGVHYPTDVLGGWTAGAVVVVLFAALTRPVSRARAAAAADVDPGAPRSDRPGRG